MNQEVMAFWKYDCYPYVLCSEVEQIENNGIVKVKGYGGSRFKYLYLCPKENGQALADRLAELEEEYNLALVALKSSFYTKIPEVLRKKINNR